jgi:hypothetical protein
MATVLTILLLFANSAFAQSVRIQNGEGAWGYGWMFSHAGNCYAALPAHVAGFLPKVTVATAAPVVSDQATIVKPFWPGIDLAIAVLDRGPLDGRCTAGLDDLKPLRNTLNASLALVLRVSPLGEEERFPLRVLDRDYLQFTGELVRDSDAIGQGTSGSFAFVDGRPIGMAVTQDDEKRATFIRSEEIHLNIERYLSEIGQAFVATPNVEAVQPGKGLVLQDVTVNTPPVLPQFGPDNILGEGIFVTTPNGPVELTFRTEGSQVTSISRLRMTAPADGQYAIPKTVIVYLDAGEKGERFRFWTQGEMRPDGIFDTGPLAGRSARWIRIVISSAWSDGDIAIDAVTAD